MIALFLRNASGFRGLAARDSRDNGRTWGEVRNLAPLPSDEGAWGSPEPLVDRDGELHVFLLKPRKKAPAGLDIDIHHMKSSEGRTRWQPPRRIWAGYTGSLNGVIQTRGGRIILPFSYMTKRTWADRGKGFDAFTYMGTFDCTVLYSDDRGETWHESPTPLKVTAPDLGTYGAIEPVVVERGDGRVWMLLRTQHGRFYESLSDDGRAWSRPRPTRNLSPDSPAGLARPIAPGGSIDPQTKLPIDRWFDLEFRWDGADRRCLVTVDGRPATTLPQNRESLGANYVRLVSTATTVDAGLLVEFAQARLISTP